MAVNCTNVVSLSEALKKTFTRLGEKKKSESQMLW